MKRLAFPTLVLAAAASLAPDVDAQRGRRARERRPEPQPAARDEQPAKEKKIESWTVIQGGDVWIGNGSILRRASVLIGDDRIQAVGHDVDVPEGAKVIDATDKVVAPGFCVVKASGFGTGRGGESVRDELNPFDPSIKLGLAAGITSFLWLADGGNDKPAGKSAVVKLAYGDLDGMVEKEGTVVAMQVPLTPQQWNDFRKLVKQAHEHLVAVDEASRRQGATPPRPPRGTEELIVVIRGKKRLWIAGTGGGRFRGGSRGGFDVENIRQALEIARLVGAGVVLDEPTEGWLVAEEIAATGSMAVISPRDRTPADPKDPDRTGSNIASAALLAAAGVPVAVTCPGGMFGGTGVGTGGILGQDLNTPHVDAAFAVRGGLDNRKALRTLTLDAARILGVDRRIGSIEAGKDADILILDGDPLHYATFVETAIVNGKVVYEKAEEPLFRHIAR